MKLKVLQESFSKALSITSRFTSNKIQLPILANVLLSASKNKLFISATNLEMAISIPLGAKVERDGEITIPARVISELVGNLTPGQISLDAEKEILKIAAQGFSSSLSGINSSDFPVVPHELDKKEVSIKSNDFKHSLNKVLFAVSSDETRPVLTGVLVVLNKDDITFVSTDGFRLSKKRIKLSSSVKDETKLIIPKNTLSELSRLEVSSDSQLVFSFNRSDNQILFNLQEMILTSRIIEGDFPDYEKIIPKDSRLKVKVDKSDLLRAVKLASVFARESANVIKVKVKKASVFVSAESSHSGSQETELDARVEDEAETLKDGEDYVIAFNYKFLEDFLGSCEGENVQINLSDANSPALFLDEEDKSFIHIIMPVRLQS
ncbi:DNA polymerase III subunit beta [Candidatus Woesebacteria bacterium RIFCSPHIGHO2_01_FULL_37_10]|uniref:Beta sliding clamp n=1 Tax=Candidatus Woesebacteria bacterium RIFCSPHIGHO2_01_FULL_37_10 TaxID=1802489 RepID=A0A1F7XW15_9BACT|nr:MAG: DNA polymerase III subunit beta [Candidatus Woesebacteria bacterium RIFCSPHIGHO2_01_FULL_37_10]